MYETNVRFCNLHVLQISDHGVKRTIVFTDSDELHSKLLLHTHLNYYLRVHNFHFHQSIIRIIRHSYLFYDIGNQIKS